MDSPRTAMDILTWLQTGRDRYLFTVRIYRPTDPVPHVPVGLVAYGYDAEEAATS